MSCPYTNQAEAPKQTVETVTVGNYLDHQIQQCRNRLENYCVLKARAEALQMLNHPQSFINDLSGWM